MNELVKALEKIHRRLDGVTDEMSIYEIETESLMAQALEEARAFAAQVAELHQVIAGNVEHSIAAWMDKHADEWQAHMESQPDAGWASEWDRPLHYHQMAQIIRQGEWRK